MSSDSRKDPGSSETSRQIPLGIDLGTTTSSVAYVDSTGRLRTLDDRGGRPLVVPSTVFFGDSVVVGEEAVRQGTTSPDSYAEGFKREMGKAHFHRAICGHRAHMRRWQTLFCPATQEYTRMGISRGEGSDGSPFGV